MTLHRNGFEGQTSGSNAMVANSANSGDAWTSQSLSGGTLTYTTARAAGGSNSLLLTTDGTNAAFFDDASFNSTSIAISDCFYYSGAPTGTALQIIQARTAVGVAANITLATNGKLSAQDAAGSNAVTAVNALTAGHWYRIELQIFSDASAGTIAMQYYLDNSGSAVESLSATGRNTRGGMITTVRRGCTSAAYTSALPYWNYDNIQASDGTTTPIGVYIVQTPPTASFTYSVTNQTVNVNANGSSAVSPATISSYSWSFGDTSSGSGSSTSHTYTTNGNYSVVLTVTDTNGLTSTTTQTISITARQPEMYVYHSSSWVPSVLYVYHAGSWTAIQ